MSEADDFERCPHCGGVLSRIIARVPLDTSKVRELLDRMERDDSEGP